MKKTLVIAAFFISIVCSAQDKYFQIIAFKGDVMLDSLSVTCGQKINQAEQILTIGKGSYASVLTSDGYAFQLGKGKHKGKKIVNQTISNLTRIKNAQGMGAVERTYYPEIIDILSIHYHREYSYLEGDTLTLIWQKKNEINTYSVLFNNLLGEELLDTTISVNVLSIDVSNKLGDKALLYRVKSEKLSSKDMIVKVFPESQDFRLDANCTSSINFIERELLLAGLCEVYNLYYDQIHHLYNLYMHSKKTGIKISHPYYQRMLKEHEFEKFFTSQQ